jgi:hypothetical protein
MNNNIDINNALTERPNMNNTQDTRSLQLGNMNQQILEAHKQNTGNIG